jgi:hypothetical protein
MRNVLPVLWFFVILACAREPELPGSPANNIGVLRQTQTKTAGDAPVNCGDVYPRSNPQKVNDCIVRSFEAKQPFHARMWLQGIDSAAAEGVAMNSRRIVYFYSFDSAPCGHPGCPAHLEERQCAKPYIHQEASGARLACADQPVIQ